MKQTWLLLGMKVRWDIREHQETLPVTRPVVVLILTTGSVALFMPSLVISTTIRGSRDDGGNV